MVKAKTKALNLLLPETLSDWFSEYAKSENKTKTEIICTLLQELKNGEAYSDVVNPVDDIETIIKTYLDNHLQNCVENILHSSKQADVVNHVESAVDDSVVNLVDDSVEKQAIADDIKTYRLVQMNLTKARAKLEELGLSGEPKSGKDFSTMYPDHFEYDANNKKLSWKKPK